MNHNYLPTSQTQRSYIDTNLLLNFKSHQFIPAFIALTSIERLFQALVAKVLYLSLCRLNSVRTSTFYHYQSPRVVSVVPPPPPNKQSIIVLFRRLDHSDDHLTSRRWWVRSPRATLSFSFDRFTVLIQNFQQTYPGIQKEKRLFQSSETRTKELEEIQMGWVYTDITAHL